VAAERKRLVEAHRQASVDCAGPLWGRKWAFCVTGRTGQPPPGALFSRGLVHRKKSDRAGGNANIAAAKAIRPDIAGTFARLGFPAP